MASALGKDLGPKLVGPAKRAASNDGDEIVPDSRWLNYATLNLEATRCGQVLAREPGLGPCLSQSMPTLHVHIPHYRSS
ncbi:hypothetical protein KCU74_g89, partial [Aureobasidium melanogenum]